MAGSGLVYIIRKDTKYDTKSRELVSKLTSYHHDIKELDFSQALETIFSSAILFIIDVSLDDYQTIKSLKSILKKPKEHSIPLFFIIGSMQRKEIIQAQTMHATDFLAHPVKVKEFTKKLKNIANNSIEKSWSNLSKIQEAALRANLKVFEDTFTKANKGDLISDEELRESCDLIIKATEEGGITTMLSAIRTHHNYTYRHSMMVSSYLSAFGLLLGMRSADLQNLTTSGLIHDIGKAHVAPELLNKPGPLTDDEWVEMRMHTEYSRKILEGSNFHPDVIDSAIHHHEKIDGSGYPDNLKGEQVSDMARMVAIADVFSGLTEKRSYKQSMTNEKAYDIMLSMTGHLDMDLLSAFKPVALNVLEAAA